MSATRETPPSNGLPLQGQIALVTGAAGALGGAVAGALSLAGAHVVATDIDAEKLEQTSRLIAERGGSVSTDVLDLGEPGSIRALFDLIVASHGRLDVLVNNAAIARVRSFEAIPADEWRATFAVNVDAPFLATQLALRMMASQQQHEFTGCRGKIINVSSGAADMARPNLAAYGASKAALNHLSRTAAVMAARSEIAVSVLYPGNVPEGLFGKLAGELALIQGQELEHLMNERLVQSPTGRFQTPDDFAAIVLRVALTPGMSLNGMLVTSEPWVTPL